MAFRIAFQFVLVALTPKAALNWSLVFFGMALSESGDPAANAIAGDEVDLAFPG
jgi:hypothetical protein